MRWRKQHRRPGWDYTLAGPYFITVCSDFRRLIFEEEAYRRVVMDTWAGLTSHFPGLFLDAFVVMPNHVHGLLQLGNDDLEECEAPAALSAATTAGEGRQSSRRYSLSEVVNALKGFSTRRINELRGFRAPVWQRGYWDRIVHTTSAADAIRAYILENPMNWHCDPYNPTRDGMVGEDAFWEEMESQGVISQGGPSP